MSDNTATLVQKWAPVLEADAFNKIKDRHRAQVTAQVLENTEHAAKTEFREWAATGLTEAAPTNNISRWQHCRLRSDYRFSTTSRYA
jgi:hypothetical protein